MIRLVTPTLQFSNASFSVLVIFHSVGTHYKQIMTKSECEEEYVLFHDLERCSPSCQEIHAQSLKQSGTQRLWASGLLRANRKVRLVISPTRIPIVVSTRQTSSVTVSTTFKCNCYSNYTQSNLVTYENTIHKN